MWRSSKRFLIVASVTLNLAFVGVWLVHAIPAGMGEELALPPARSGPIWCPLHQQLDVTPEQWARIEPLLKDFRRSARSVCGHVNELRLEMMELIAAPDPDREAIAAKQAEIQAGQRRMQGLLISHLLAEKEILTPEQQERLFTLIREQGECAPGGPRVLSGRARGGIGRMFRDGTPAP